MFGGGGEAIVSTDRTRKSGSALPDDISRRLKDVLTRAMKGATDKIYVEVTRMFRFANMDVVQATHQVLEEKGAPMKMDEIVEELKAGGIWRPATRAQGSSADVELKRSIGKAASHGVMGHGAIAWVDKKRGPIGLTEWRLRQ